jgi:hypothetical protein
MRRTVVAALSLAFTGLFFVEYLPPLQRVHVPYDLEGFHYPLADYAFLSLKQHRFPEWDPTMYCGLSFAANPQAALFYPPSWLLFLGHVGQRRLSFLGLELLVLLHVWMAFFFCYLWLREKTAPSRSRLRTAVVGSAAAVDSRIGTGLWAADFSSLLGAGAFAYGGYLMSQMQHAGVVMSYAWFPLGLWGVDRAAAGGAWRDLWRLVGASAMCFLAGYPPTWFVLAVVVVVYAAVSYGWRWAAFAGAALVASLLVAMVQLLPALEVSRLKTPELKYGGGIHDAPFWISYWLPNYHGLGLESQGTADPTGQYFYLGAPVFLALLWAARRRRWRPLAPALAVAAVSLVLITNPWGMVERVVGLSSWLEQICRDWNFLAGLGLAAALITAVALDDFLRSGATPAPGWVAPAVMVMLVGWSIRQMLVWLPGGADFFAGWRAASEPVTMLALLAVGLWAFRAAQGPRRAALAVLLLAAVGIDYKVFGTSRRFNAELGSVDQFHRGVPFRGLDDRVYREMRAHPEFRVALDETAPRTTELRHYGLTTPQGFDPLLPARYRDLIAGRAGFRTDREFYIHPSNHALLELLGVRYFLTTPASPNYAALASDPGYRRLEPSATYFHAFEFLAARPSYRWEATDGSAEITEWTPERRGFVVRSASGGRLALIEQFLPGWEATVDDVPAPVVSWEGAFQQVQVGPGGHRVQFRYRAAGLRLGAATSLAAVALLWGLARKP